MIMGKSPATNSGTHAGPLPWSAWPYRIGCPVWACKHWAGQVYPARTPSAEYLDWYSRAFPTVEGNTTFYSVPAPDVFRKWCDQACDGFRFCFKFPKTISHDKRLVSCQDELRQWLGCLEILANADRLGPTFLQLAPSFSSRHFDHLAQFLTQLPRDWPWAVEVRHADWFDDSQWEHRLDDLLHEHRIDRVLFDSSPLNAQSASDATELASQHRKPKVPLRTTITGKRPMLRLIGRNHLEEVTNAWDSWAERIAQWIRDGLEPWIFTHAPDDAFAPTLVHAMHDRIAQRLEGLPKLPTLETISLPPPLDRPIQLRLF
jgi:uncharacterized protein YecE (DUF72 family)